MLSKFKRYSENALITIGILFALTVFGLCLAGLADAAGYSSRPVTGVFGPVQFAAKTVTGSATYGCGTALTACSVFYIRPYNVPDTLDLVVQAGANSYTATYSYKIKAAAANNTTEFGPFYTDAFDSTVNWYLGMTPTTLDASTTATVYVRSYQPIRHNY